jgi:hypothetical protein
MGESYQGYLNHRENRRDLLAQLVIKKLWPAIVTVRSLRLVEYWMHSFLRNSNCNAFGRLETNRYRTTVAITGLYIPEAD